jgi:manganese/iron transport system permease protein
MNIVDWLFGPFALPFIARPMLVMVILAIAVGVASVLVTLRSLQFVGDGLVHAIFPGIVVGFTIAGRDGLLVGGLIAAAIGAVALTLIGRRALSNDSAIAIVLTTMFAVGVIIVSQQSGYVGQLEELLFGRLLTVTESDVITTAIVAGLALIALLVVARTQLFRAHDERAALAAGHRVLASDLVAAVAIAMLVVVATAAVGNLLALGLLIVPGAFARLLTDRLLLLVPLAIAMGIVASWAGLWAAYRASVDLSVPLPGGAAVIAMLVLIYLVTLGVRHVIPSRDHTGRSQREALDRARVDA